MNQNPEDTSSVIDALRKIIEEFDKTSKEFLSKRNLLDPQSKSFGKNPNSDNLQHPCGVESSRDKPFVLFSACPKLPLKNTKIKSKEFHEWICQSDTMTIKSHKTPCLPSNRRKFDLDSVTYDDDYNGRINKYLELHENGFIEQGFTYPLIYDLHNTEFALPFLDLCYMTGTFWAFVKFCKKYYDFINFTKEFDIRLSIRNSKELSLTGFGGTVEDGSRYASPTDRFSWHQGIPHTRHSNILLLEEISSNASLTDDTIEQLVHEISDKISNAYNLESARCYNHDGSFNFKLFSEYGKY